MNDKIKINLSINDSNYPLSIQREEEEIHRKAAKQINDRLNKYRGQYPGLESGRLLAMVAYEFSLDNLKLIDKNDTLPYTTKIENLTQELEDYFKK